MNKSWTDEIFYVNRKICSPRGEECPFFVWTMHKLERPLEERATMERWFWTQQSSINHTTQAAGKNICKRVWKTHPPRNANQKSGFPGTKLPLCEPQVHSRFPGSSHRAARLGWSSIFAKSWAKEGLFLWSSHFEPLQPAWFLGIIGVELQSTPR